MCKQNLPITVSTGSRTKWEVSWKESHIVTTVNILHCGYLSYLRNSLKIFPALMYWIINKTPKNRYQVFFWFYRWRLCSRRSQKGQDHVTRSCQRGSWKRQNSGLTAGTLGLATWRRHTGVWPEKGRHDIGSFFLPFQLVRWESQQQEDAWKTHFASFLF